MMMRILMIALVSMLAACASSVSKTDTYTDHNGNTTVIESDHGLCVHSCNDDYGRCMDVDSTVKSGGVNAPAGMFGASADCHDALKDCLTTCKGR